MQKLKNIALTIAIFIGIKIFFAINARMAVDSVSAPLMPDQRQVATLVEATSQPSKPTDGFERLTLNDGVQVDVPIQWEPLPKDLTNAMRTTANALISNEGINTEPDQSRLLIAYTSRPTSTYASIRVKETIPAPISPAELLSASNDEIASLAPELVQLISRAMAKQEQDIQPGATTTRELVSGHPALIFRYRRLGGEKGIVAVEQIKIMTPKHEISVTLSYRESEAILWRPVIENIRRSIKVPS